MNGIEKIRDLSSREAKYLDDLINTAKIYRLKFIATKRWVLRDNRAVALKWRQKKTPLLFNKIKELQEIVDLLKDDLEIQKHVQVTRPYKELTNFTSGITVDRSYAYLVNAFLEMYSIAKGRLNFLGYFTNIDPVKYIKNNGYAAALDLMQKEKQQRIQKESANLTEAKAKKELRAEEQRLHDAEAKHNTEKQDTTNFILKDKNWSSEYKARREIADFLDSSLLGQFQTILYYREYLRDIYKEVADEIPLEKIVQEIAKPINLKSDKDIPTLRGLSNRIAKEEQKSKMGPQKKQAIVNNMKKVFAANKMGMNVDSTALELILYSGVFKNQFETQTSGGYLPTQPTLPNGRANPSSARTEAAANMFGTPMHPTLMGSEYEKYGYLMTADIERGLRELYSTNTDQYGLIQIRFNDRIKDVTTFTPGDSLRNSRRIFYQPSKVTNPSAVTYENIRAYNADQPDGRIRNFDILDFSSNYVTPGEYLELQFHGEIPISLVESISFPYNLEHPGNLREKEIALKWKRTFAKAGRDVKIYYLDSARKLQELKL